jgi:hypothetical protein
MAQSNVELRSEDHVRLFAPPLGVLLVGPHIRRDTHVNLNLCVSRAWVRNVRSQGLFPRRHLDLRVFRALRCFPQGRPFFGTQIW